MTQRHPIALPVATDTARPASLLRQCSVDYASSAARREQDHRDDAHLVAYSQPISGSIREPLYGSAAVAVRDQLREPSDLAVAVSLAKQTLARTEHIAPGIADLAQAVGSTRATLRILLRALGALEGETA